MSKSLMQIIPLLIKIEENFSRLYNNIATIEGQYNGKLRSAAMVLSRQELDHANKYRNLQTSLAPESLMIDDHIYSMIQSNLINFISTMKKESFNEPNDFLHYAIDCEKRTGDLLREVKSLDLPEEVDQLIDELILAEDAHSSALSQFLN